MQTPTYSVRINPPKEAARSFTSFLFNDPLFLAQQPCEAPLTFALWHNRRQQIDAWFHLFVKDKQGYSPCRAPFGSIEFSPALSLGYLHALIEAIHVYAQQQGLVSIRITSYPECYAATCAPLLSYTLLRHGYTISVQDLNFHIPVTNVSFETNIRSSERWHIRKCLRASFTFAAETQPDLRFVHAFIEACRVRRGFPMSSDFNSFEQMFTYFPDVYGIFTVRDHGKVVALGVTVRVNAAILYTFYLADEAGYQSYSPTVLLLKGIYEYAQQAGYRMLDLGIATDRGVANEGLIHFKRSMGGIPSLKPSFVNLFELPD